MSGALETLLLGLCSCLLPSNQRGCGAAASAPVESILRAGWWLSWKESWECGDVVQCISSTCPKILHLQRERVFVLKGQFTWKTQEPVVLFIHLNCSVVSLELSALSACGAQRVTVMHLKKTQQQCLLPKILNRSLKITCRPFCEPEQIKEQFIQKNQECLFPSLPQFLEIVLMWVLQISALKMSASSQMWYHQICSVFFLLVLRGFVSLCFSLLPTNFHPDHGGGEGQAQEEASGQGGVGGELQRPELGDLLSVTWRHAALEPAQTPSHEALQVSLRRRAGPGREGRHPHCRYDVSHGKKTEAEVSVRGMYVSAHYSCLCSALVLILKTLLYHCC